MWALGDCMHMRGAVHGAGTWHRKAVDRSLELIVNEQRIKCILAACCLCSYMCMPFVRLINGNSVANRRCVHSPVVSSACNCTTNYTRHQSYGSGRLVSVFAVHLVVGSQEQVVNAFVRFKDKHNLNHTFNPNWVKERKGWNRWRKNRKHFGLVVEGGAMQPEKKTDEIHANFVSWTYYTPQICWLNVRHEYMYIHIQPTTDMTPYIMSLLGSLRLASIAVLPKAQNLHSF